jgi:hypothetical protein
MEMTSVPEGVTLVEFEEICQEVDELAPAQEASPPKPEGSEEVILECP